MASRSFERAHQHPLQENGRVPLESAVTSAPPNTPLREEESSESYVLNEKRQTQATEPKAPEVDPKRCWICQMDDTEDGPDDGPWLHPCPCSLQAHEECLMEWIAAEGDNQGQIAPKIVCPVCKYEFVIDAPRDPLILAFDKLQRLGKLSMLPLFGGALCEFLYSGLLAYGVNSMELVFGTEEALAILANPIEEAVDTPSILYRFAHHPAVTTIVRFAMPFSPTFSTTHTWGALVGLPLVLPTLILSGTREVRWATNAVSVGYLIFNPDTNKDILTWPPTPGHAFTFLSFATSTYFSLYKHTFGDLERQWDQALRRKPREGETAEQIEQAHIENDVDGALGFNLAVEVEMEEVLEDENGMEIRELRPDGQEPGRNAEGVAFAGDVQNAREDGQRLQHNHDAGNHQHEIHLTSMISSAVGSLLFPHVASLMGEALKYALPSVWVRQRGLTPTGLLQQKWGRSIVGGVLFVVLKDVVVLYCKWKKARDFQKKKIREYVKK